ncbi:hypothetical protein EH31_06555 [Erythrobacter longus]|uniref:Uncharacterized protein n=1 Tax=Erythrobacter longus TaxID=1044 RepID=A0A074LXA0_ERYLO|nr:hypothetical protein [Erythrobacter longus]KEO86741.1 hypothetical protein EH31_06555 [Erythrobacter longus]
MTCLVHASGGGSDRPLLTKVITPTEIQNFDNVAKFDLHNLDITTFDELVSLIDWLSKEPHMALIRGQAIREGPNQFRRLRPRAGAPATIRASAEGEHWIMLDIDKYVLPDFIDDKDEMIDLIISELPAPFQDSSFVYQWSSSSFVHGDVKTVSIHLFFALKRPRTCYNLHTRTMRGDWSSGLIDAAPFNPIQLHYTASPIFKDRVIDPLSDNRTGVRFDRNDTVDLKPFVEPRTSPNFRTGGAPLVQDIDGLISVIGDDGHIHAATRTASYAYARQTPFALRSDDTFISKVMEQIAKAGRGDDYSEHYVKRMIDTAVVKITR